jgi:YD repeat-containing protein
MADIVTFRPDGIKIKAIDMGDGAHAERVVADAPNWATSFTWSGGNIATETRTRGDVTQTRAYTYDGSGNLVTIGAWQ